jgi:hypothetical protein
LTENPLFDVNIIIAQRIYHVNQKRPQPLMQPFKTLLLERNGIEQLRF